jgi:hypothetical protein
MDQPWLNEPDFAKWRDPATGLLCAIVRQKDMQFLCGYVQIPFGKLRKKILRIRRIPGRYEYVLLRGIEAHGGLSFFGFHKNYRLSRGYWIGFDCAHAYDFMPGMMALLNSLQAHSGDFMRHDTYRDFAYVKAEVTDLARQVARIEKKQI